MTKYRITKMGSREKGYEGSIPEHFYRLEKKTGFFSRLGWVFEAGKWAQNDFDATVYFYFWLEKQEQENKMEVVHKFER